MDMEIKKIVLPMNDNDEEQNLFITTIPKALNQKLNNYVEKISPQIQSRYENSWFNRVFGTRTDMNNGISDDLIFDKDTWLSNDQRFIIDQAYNLMTQTGFCVSKTNGYLNVDIFHLNAVNQLTHESTCNDDTAYHSCVFYTQKDENVKGDLKIYSEMPSLFYDGKTLTVPTETGMAVLRSGNVCYDIEPPYGHGKEHIITVCFEKL